MAGGGPQGRRWFNGAMGASGRARNSAQGIPGPPSRQILPAPAPSDFAAASEAPKAPAKAPASLQFRGCPGARACA